MRIDVLTLFPEVMQPYLTASIMGRASAAGVVDFHLHQLRDYSKDSHRKVDDRPFGGGPGMVLMCQPVVDAVEAIEKSDPRPALRILLTPQGRSFSQDTARRFAQADRLLLISGHYEGFDERIAELLQPQEVSLGDFVLSGGEIAALAVVDAVVRLLPGALGCEESAGDESFEAGMLEYPQYTRPREFRGLSVPEVLLSGNHAEIEAWRRSQAESRTRQRRPDLLSYAPSEIGQPPFSTLDGLLPECVPAAGADLSPEPVFGRSRARQQAGFSDPASSRSRPGRDLGRLPVSRSRSLVSRK